VILLAAFLWNSQALAGIASALAKWPNNKDITVCFFGGTPETRTAIAQIAQEWTADLGVHFAFGKPDAYNSCVPDQTYDVRVGFDTLGNWAYLGRDALAVPQDRPTVNLSELKEGESSGGARFEVLHVFGHVLGMLDQEQDPKFCQTELNRDYLRSIGLTDDYIKQNFLPPGSKDVGAVPDNGRFVSTAFDTASVMRVLTNPEFFTSGVTSPCYGPPVDRPSAEDLRLARLLYPPKPTEVSAVEPGHLTIRFDGVLAAEHFGYVIDALYAVGAVRLKKHVFVVNETLEDVIARENLAPRGVTSRSLDDFLCRVNAHICVAQKGKNVWKGTVATKNYVDEGKECGDPTLPKFVVCIPNVRLEKYMTISDISIDANHESLSNIVVTKFHGCDTWDQSCRDLIGSLNSGTTVSNVDQLFKSSYVGRVLLPIVGYRLVIEYSNDQQRDQIEKAVNEVANDRARQLGIIRSAVLIDVTYPLGTPKPHGSHGGESQPEWYKTEQYPDGDPTIRQTHDGIDVAVWDLHVDKEHCELKTGGQSLIYPTASQSSAGSPPPPPDSTPNCGTMRDANYRPSRAYDHGTAVAGAISAVSVNDAGVSGIAPGTKVWSWEVVDGNQFNAGDNPILIQRKQYPNLHPRVINISQSYPILEPGKKSNLENYLFGGGVTTARLDRIVLFVAAAGDVNGVGLQIDSTQAANCPIYPACWSNGLGEAPRGIISVVALDANGTSVLQDKNTSVPQGAPPKFISNYGLAFDVAAVGDMLSTLHGNWVGSVQGSSFAAPQVSGLAILLYAKADSQLMPLQNVIEVKNRILFTTDEPKEIRGLSRFGRINFEKALNFENDRIRYAKSPQCEEDPCWKKVQIDRAAGAFVAVTGTSPTGQPFSQRISYEDLKSIRRDTEDDLFTVFYTNGKYLIRVDQASITPDNKSVVKTDHASYPFQLDRVLEYVSCSWCNN
jgi:hypothetical protein